MRRCALSVLQASGKFIVMLKTNTVYILDIINNKAGRRIRHYFSNLSEVGKSMQNSAERETPFHEVELLSTAVLLPAACEDSTLQNAP